MIHWQKDNPFADCNVQRDRNYRLREQALGLVTLILLVVFALVLTWLAVEWGARRHADPSCLPDQSGKEGKTMNGIAMKANGAACLVPGCEREPYLRGNCLDHYYAIADHVIAGRFTWEALEKRGKTLPIERVEVLNWLESEA